MMVVPSYAGGDCVDSDSYMMQYYSTVKQQYQQ